MYGEADGYLIVYSVASRESFNDAVSILKQMKKTPELRQKVVILVGNKQDMVRKRVVKTQGKVKFMNP